MTKNTIYILLRSFFVASGIIILSFLVTSESKVVNNKGGESDLSGLNLVKSVYESDTTKGVKLEGGYGYPETVSEIMKRENNTHLKNKISESEEEVVYPDRRNLPQNPASPLKSSYPDADNSQSIQSPQTVGTNFTAATLQGTNPTLAFPADNMGAVGPTQYIIAVNGRIVTFLKTTGSVDGVLNTSTDNFFTSVRNGSGTSDPRIRYDRLSGRWFLTIVNVVVPNRILIAVSNTSTITVSTTWTFFFIPINSTNPPIANNCLMDYPTLGIDVNALYIGGNNFCGGALTFNSTDGYVVNKNSILGAGPLVVTVFRGLVANRTAAGPFGPQGVDNFDASSTEGYFIGVDNATFGTLQIRRVSNPGGTPTISSNITLTVNATTFPPTVNHLGNTGGTNGKLDALDDRLFNAVIRNGRLWTTHNIGVNNTGVSSGTITRAGSRWYEIQNLTTTPTLVESGTIFKSTSNNTTDSINYWIPSIMISGQGHVAVSISSAGTNDRINSTTVGRLATDPLGVMGTPLLFTASTTAYNPPGDNGLPRGARRWGDYSFVSLDPNDDMTMWGVHGFCDVTNSYGVRVAQIKAPPPATPTSANPSIIGLGVPSTVIIITGTSVNGSGYFDPGAGFPNHISATVTGGVTVNSTTYNSPTQVTIDVNTVSATSGPYSVTIINPDGQSATGNNLFDSALPVELISFNGTISNKNSVVLNWSTNNEINNSGFEIERKKADDQNWTKTGFVRGHGNTNSVTNYNFTDSKLNAGKYNYRLKQMDFNGTTSYFNLNSVINISVPNNFSLSQNYPNPFNPTTKIDYNLANETNVNLKVYDATGRLVSVLVNEKQLPGYYTKEFNAGSLASGVYFYRLIAGSFIDTKRFVVIK